MKKIALISDVHFGVNKNSEMFLKNSLNYFKNEFVPYLKENGITKIYVLGDLYENRTSINVRVNSEVYHLFTDILSDFEITITLGNHDLFYNNTTDVHSLKYLNNFKNIRIVDKPVVEDIYGTKVLLCPWITDYNDSKITKLFKNSEAEVLFGHFDIIGFSLNNFKINTDVGFSIKDFINFKKVFTGHYHKFSSKKIKETEIVYLGSPYQTNRNDLNDDKGFIVLDMETIKYERILNKTSIKYIDIQYPNIPTEKEINGNIITLHINIDKKDIVGDVIEKYIAKIEGMNPVDKVNINLNIHNDEASTDILQKGITSVEDLMEMYVNDNDSITDKEEILKIVKEIYNEVK